MKKETWIEAPTRKQFAQLAKLKREYAKPNRFSDMCHPDYSTENVDCFRKFKESVLLVLPGERVTNEEQTYFFEKKSGECITISLCNDFYHGWGYSCFDC